MYLHPWAITAGMAALGLPFLVHWLTRPRPHRLSLSTVKFVREVVSQRRARNRLRDWIILLLRAAAVALFAFALARPLSGNRVVAGRDQQSKTVKVVLLDISQSMGAVANGIQSMERARPVAARHVDYQPETQSNLILGGATPRAVFDRPSTNVSALIDEVSRATPVPQRFNVQAGLNQAADMLSNVSGDNVKLELVVISDFQRANWVAADFSVLPVNTSIQLESVAPEETPANLSMVRVAPQGRVEAGRPFRLEVEVGNFSPTPRQVAIDVTIGEQPFHLKGTCPAGGNTTLVTEAVLPNEGWQSGEARLVGLDDGLADDNRRPVVVRVHPRPSYLLLTRQPAGTRPTSSYFLERALAPRVPDREAREKIIRLDPTRLETETLTAADLVILDHPGKLTEESIELIASLMLRGRGVLYVAAEPIDATNLKLLSKSAGTSLQLPVEFAPPGAGQVRQKLFVTDLKSRQTPFSVFGEEAMAMVAPLRFSGGLGTRRVDGALLDDVCATYNDQSACLVLTACGAGSIAILNADLGSSNLPSSPAFVPLIGELVAHLLGRDRSQEQVSSGEPIAVFLPPAATPRAGLQIQPGTSIAVEPGALGELHEEPVGVLWQAAAAGPPGVYSIRRGPQTVYALASTIPAEEADLMTISSDLITTRLAGGRELNYRSALEENDERDDFWSKLAVACVLCLCAEFAGLRFFRA